MRRSGTLTAEEITNAHADINTAYDAVARLRPNWLNARSSAQAGSNFATVFVDEQLVGDITSLRNISASQIGDIRYYDPSQAGARFGLRAGTNGSIEVTMKQPGRP